MSQVVFEEALSRVGLQVLGGNLTQVPWSTGAAGDPVCNVAWAGRDMGIFVVDCAGSKIVDLETSARKDVVVCSAVLSRAGFSTNFVVGDSRFEAKHANMMMACVPQHKRFQFATSVSQGLRAITVVADLMSMMEARRLPLATLPKSLLRMIQGRQIALETFDAGLFFAIARDVAVGRPVFPSLPALYYEGKTLELVSALLGEIARRDALLDGNSAFDPGVLDRLGQVKKIIDRAPHRTLDVDSLARVSAMNRTKLRSAFKQVYGTTLSDYRTTLMLQRADCALRNAGASVKQAARLAGYATTSSFIVAYKRRYGVCPGNVRRD